MDSNEYKVIKLGQVLDLETGEGVYLEVANAQIWLKKTAQTTALFYQYQTKKKNVNPPKDAAWSKWVTIDKKIHVGFLPCLPEMPVQLTFREPLFVPEGNDIAFYYLFPTWIAVKLGKQLDILLGEFQSLQLSHTWNGNFFEGELIYEDFPEVYFERPETVDPTKITCPLTIINKGNSNLVADKQILRLENLAVYADEQNFWTNKAQFEYTKSSELTDVKFSQNFLKSIGKFTLIQKPRNLDKKSVLLKKVSPIKMHHTISLPNR
ncbi:MAG: hypothetical protein IH595_02160 [Bacteroidales bacterium]|nr:hypothetical protein [Bacteroidales bacterium]